MPKQKSRFRIEIEATLYVDAFDEASAQRKVRSTFRAKRPLGPDVETTGIVDLYSVKPEAKPGP